MENNRLQPLTEIEKDYATANHNIIYSFLHRFGYDIEEYYNIVVMGYLRAVQVYHRREDLRKQYSFLCISYQYMRSEIGNYFKALKAEKRKTTEPIISLDAEYADMEKFYNCIGGKNIETELLEKETIKELLENFSEVQRKITEMKMEGYNNKEIYLILEIKPSTYYKELQRIKSSLENLVG